MISFDSIFKTALLSAAMMLAVQTGKAQTIPLSTLGTAYTQDFDGLSSTATSSTNVLAVNGWSMTETGGGPRDNEQYAVDNGGSSTGDTYSYGAAGNSDRAFGGLQSGTLIPLIGAVFTNTTGATITSLVISYVGEQWRIGNTAAARDDRMTFEYSTSATALTGTYTPFTAGDFISPIKTNATASALNGNLPANRAAISFTITGLTIANGADFWIRWTDVNATGSDDGLAIDDFTLTPYGAPAAPEMDIQGNAVSIADGSAFPVAFNNTYFGNQSICAGAVSHTYTILNTGTAVLNLTAVPTVSLSGPGAADFTVTAQPSATIAAGGSSTFVIAYDPSVAGSSSAIVEIANNDSDENPYEFYILGVGVEAVISASTQTNVACNGGSNGAISVNATGTGTLSYDWEPGAITGDGTASVTGLAPGVYSITVTDQGTCQAMATFTVTEPAALILAASVTHSVICSGNSATLSAMANGGTGTVTYTWSTMENTASISVSPTVTSTYTINIADANNCAQSGTVSVTVNDLPVIAVNSGTICAGESFTITASGANTYTYSGGSDVVSPSADATYTVTGTDMNGCENMGVTTISVNALPTVAAVTNNTLLCTGETASLTASGADTYTWSTTEMTAVIAVSPTSTTDYTVTGTDVNGCMNTAVVTQDVSTCTGIVMIEQRPVISVYPNPSSGELMINLIVNSDVEISNQLGQVIYSKHLEQGQSNVDISSYAKGIYFLKSNIDGKTNVTKIVKQ